MSTYLIHGEYMNITLKLGGIPEEIINEMLAKKIATNRTEAVRLAIMDYNEHHQIKDQMSSS